MSDRSPFLEDRTQEIAADITELVKRNTKLERMLGRLGLQGDSSQLHSTLDEEHEAAKALSRKIVEELKNAQGDKRTMQKLTSQFKAALEQFKKLHAEFERKEQRVVKAYNNAHHQTSGYQQSDSSSVTLDMEGGGMAQESQQSQEEQVTFTEYEAEEIEKRRAEIIRLEHDTGEVADMFQDLALLINQQGEVLDRIEDNISSSKALVTDGHSELVSAEDYQMKARKRKCCLLFIMLAVAGAIVAFVYLFK